MATERQVAANRENGSRGGVKTEEGKSVSRLNARKHGIFASALSPEDSESLHGVEDELIAALRPVGRLEEMVVEKIALTYLRMQRCARAEAEYHIRTWGGNVTLFRDDWFERMVKLIDLYDSRMTNQFLKLTREIERLQRLRADTDSPWPAAPEVAQADAKESREAPPPEAAVHQAPITPIPPISPITPTPPAPPAARLSGQMTEAEADKFAYALVAEEAERVRARARLQNGARQEDRDEPLI